jgi:putative transcriptional regulator
LNTNQKSCERKENVCNMMMLMILCNYTYIEVIMMAISYKKLWKLLIDRDMKKKDLQKLAGISSATITKLGKNENVSTEIIQKICIALECDVCDIMEMDTKRN